MKTLAPDASNSIAFRTLLHILACRRRIILLSTLLGGCSLFCLSWLLQNSYEATAIVLTPDQSQSLVGGSLASGTSSGLSVLNPADRYVALMSVPGVENELIKRFHLEKHYHDSLLSRAREDLENHTEIRVNSKSGLISISAIDHDPDLAAMLANGVIEEYDHAAAQRSLAAAGRTSTLLRQKEAETEGNLISSEDNLRSVEQATGLLDPSSDASEITEFGAQLRAKISETALQLQASKLYLSDENSEVKTAQRRLKSLQEQAAVLNREGHGRLASRRDVAEDTIENLQSRRSVKYTEGMLDLFTKSLDLMKIKEVQHEGDVPVFSAAVTPDLKFGPFRSLFLLVGLSVGALFSSAWAVINWGIEQRSLGRTTGGNT